jgi:hypothetical protein
MMASKRHPSCGLQELPMKRIGTVAASLLFPLATAALAEGLSAPPDVQAWPSWQARRLLLTPPPMSYPAWWAGNDATTRSGAASNTSLLLGDYYFSLPGWQLRQGSLRASTGLMLSTRPLGNGLRLGEAAETTSSLPYLGLGYAGLSAKGGWTISADLGLVVENPAAAGGLGRALLGHQGLDAVLREMRFTPLLKMAVNYAF